MNESDVIGFVNKYDIPVVKSPCPADGHTKREYMKDYFSQDVLLSLVGTGIVIRPNSVKIDQQLVDNCRALGFDIEAYGLPVGNAELLKQLKKWGIGGGTCNDWIF